MLLDEGDTGRSGSNSADTRASLKGLPGASADPTIPDGVAIIPLARIVRIDQHANTALVVGLAMLPPANASSLSPTAGPTT